MLLINSCGGVVVSIADGDADAAVAAFIGVVAFVVAAADDDDDDKTSTILALTEEGENRAQKKTCAVSFGLTSARGFSMLFYVYTVRQTTSDMSSKQPMTKAPRSGLPPPPPLLVEMRALG